MRENDMSLNEEVRSAQIRGGEDAVIRNLERLGLAPKNESRLEVLEREHVKFFERWHNERRRREALELSIRDIFPAAHRLALELECLLLACTDTCATATWWESANEALEHWREVCDDDTRRNAAVTGDAPIYGAASSERSERG